MKTVYFVRHGECESNLKRLIAGSGDGLPYDTFLETEHLQNGHVREYQIKSAVH